MEDNFNKHLGNKLKLRRLALGLTQTKVAKAINVTFQQIQKYEKGTNGVSSIRLLQLSNYLKVPINYFFEDFSEYLINLEKSQEGHVLNLLSLGLTAIAVSPSIVSGLVVAISINESLSLIAYLICQSFPFTSLNMTSSSLSAVCDFGHQLKICNDIVDSSLLACLSKFKILLFPTILNAFPPSKIAVPPLYNSDNPCLPMKFNSPEMLFSYKYNIPDGRGSSRLFSVEFSNDTSMLKGSSPWSLSEFLKIWKIIP